MRIWVCDIGVPNVNRVLYTDENNIDIIIHLITYIFNMALLSMWKPIHDRM